jgi:hypothetical protein
MGLDQYLSAKKTISGSEWSAPEDRLKYAEVIDLVNASSIADADHPYITIDVTVAYWRKANAIHNWFVQECNEGNDDGNAFHVSREQLEALYQLCYTVPKGLAIHGDEYADEHLPTTSGFFFGSTEYDEWYLDSLKYTAEVIDKLLNDPATEYLDFEYRASW